MTRPQIIRADTLDLQDKSSPTAQDHSLQPEHPAPLGIGPAAPHQQAAIRHVQQERTSEELRLADAWSVSGTTLRDDPGSDDERTVVNHNANPQNGMQQDEQAIRLNGGHSGDGDDADMQDADIEEDLDDDMMDKISSSPSIDDGGYFLPSQPPIRPQRNESLTPSSSPIASSSPFTNTPEHFPVSVSSARRLADVPAQDEDSENSSASPSPTSTAPFSYAFSSTHQSTEHHRGEYYWTRPTAISAENKINIEDSTSPRTQETSIIERRAQILREDSQGSLLSDLGDDPARPALQPVCVMPLGPNQNRLGSSTTQKISKVTGDPLSSPELPDEDDDSWTTASDTDSCDDLDSDDDASNDVSFSDDPRYIDSGWGGECLRDTEDIDFEFVYALHTFVATVEGQANATKGDTMVLLDDSNSYWWLVRVVKDSSIGYLPAEHIETPTERLARLNKHRNIDLSATMLGDTAEKSKNPLKKAMRRRNAKTVQFAPPTYVEASDYDYSSDEGDGELFGGPTPKQIQQQSSEEQQAAQKSDAGSEDGLKVQPLKVNGGKKDQSKSEGESRKSNEEQSREDEEKQRASEDALDKPLDPKVSRNGTLRNTDSFFKDENTETRKITLTPNLLRDDSSTSTNGSRERGPSLESLEKNGFADKVKDDKKKKEKKAGMLSGLFKRKDKKAKGQPDPADSDAEKLSEEIDRSSPQSRSVDESTERPSGEQPVAGPQRSTSKGKLQKVPRSRDDSPQKTKGILKTDSPVDTPTQSTAPSDVSESKRPEQQAAGSLRLVPAEQDDSSRPSFEERASTQAQQSVQSQPEKVTQAKQRMLLDDFDSDDESDPFADPDAQAKTQPSEPSGRLSESPVHVSAADAQPPSKTIAQFKDKETDAQHPPGLTQDNSSQETSSPVSTPTPDDSPMKTIPENNTVSTFRAENNTSPTKNSAPAAAAIPPPSRPAPIPEKTDRDMQPSPPTSSESTQLPAWSDAALRAYLDDGSDVRDMLLLVNDTTGVVPVGRDHPIMSTLFVEDTKALQGMSTELDRLLGGLMDKRMKRAGSAASKASTARSANGSLR